MDIQEEQVKLKRFDPSLVIIENPKEECNSQSVIPQYWREAFNCDTKEERIQRILTEWKKFNYQFSDIIEFLERELKEVFLVSRKGSDSAYSLFYRFKNKDGYVVEYEGRIPKKVNIEDEELKKIWSGVPQSIIDVYENLHDGWVLFGSDSCGLTPSQYLSVMGLDEWGILEELDNPEEIQKVLDTSIGFFSNGSFGYLAVDTTCEDKEKGFFMFIRDRDPVLNVNF
ncbi:hypothetical protein AV926_09295 [Myroides marinus]|uniref:SMI1 / KNR4 family (SUKH-1) n=1 Tax=Myroides marinus TaxID=703342 RepID=A0A161S786_9FLAO|nr:hypothetical protein [Myroides marinus]KZE80959.1 hypothetical protein AV926_09295 [Myroides marinus]